jgi:hypothetical protein
MFWPYATYPAAAEKFMLLVVYFHYELNGLQINHNQSSVWFHR